MRPHRVERVPREYGNIKFSYSKMTIENNVYRSIFVFVSNIYFEKIPKITFPITILLRQRLIPLQIQGFYCHVILLLGFDDVIINFVMYSVQYNR